MAGLDSLRNAVLSPSPSIPEGKAAAESRYAQTEHRLLRVWLPLASLIVLYVALATAYNVTVPLYEAPDEHSHVAYVDHLQRTRQIPDIPRIYEAAGPPLYHAVGAAVMKVAGFYPPYIELPENPEYPAQQNRFLHEPDENDFPYEGSILGIHVLRGVSTIFGVGTVILVYMIAMLLFPGRPLLAWAAAANTALLPQFLFVGGAVMNDTAVAFFAAAAIYSSLRVVREGSALWVLVAAASLGLGFLTEGSTIAVAVACALGLLMSPLSWRGRGLALCTLVAVPLMIAGWFYIRNLSLFGDIYPAEELSGDGPAKALTDKIYREVFLAALQESYWYTGGWLTVRVALVVYQFLNVVAGLALAGLIVMLIRDKLTVFQRRGILLLIALFALTVLEILYVNTRIGYEPQGRFLFIAQPAIAMMFALGINALFQRNSEKDHFSIVFLPILLFALNIGILTLTIPTVYQITPS